LLQACNWLKNHTGLSWSLEIAGTGDAQYVDSLQAKIDQLGLQGQRKDNATQRLLPGQVEMIGEVIGTEKERLFANADLLVVPSYVENFGNVVAEALARTVPVIASRGTPWSKVEAIGCGLWVENDPTSLATAIQQMSRLPLREMGRKGREWMQREFGWQRQTQEMLAYYERLSDRSPVKGSTEGVSSAPPSHLRTDRRKAA
jgi:glycosyltransferase involved in cell wall biosynthesis